MPELGGAQGCLSELWVDQPHDWCCPPGTEWCFRLWVHCLQVQVGPGLVCVGTGGEEPHLLCLSQLSALHCSPQGPASAWTPGLSTMAKPGRDMELNHLVRIIRLAQVTPGLPPNLVELPNVPSYRPSITRIPVLISRRTNLSNSSFIKETGAQPVV